MNIPTLHTQKITLRYGEHTIIRDLTLDISQPEIVTIIGPNGSGKSTLLKALCRLLEPASGAVYLDSKDINKMSTEEVARTLAGMAQSANAPGGTTVEELVCYGRMPYRRFFDGLNQEDRLAIEEALEFTELGPLRTRLVHTLSGGERQRAWLAMALAQKPKILLLDEPTTYLDICHQLEVMQLLDKLNKELGLTVVMVIHDLNHAIQYADYVAVIKAGRLVVSGEPKEIVTSKLLADVFRVQADEFACSNGLPALVPITVCR